MDLLDILENQDNSLVPEITASAKRLSISGTGEVLRRFFDSVSAICLETASLEESRYATLQAVGAAETFKTTISARSADMAITHTSFDVDVHVSGTVIVPAKQIVSILSVEVARKAKKVTLTVLSDQLTITAGRAVWKVALPNVSTTVEQLSSETVDVAHAVEIPTDELKAALTGTVSVCYKGVARVALAQILIDKGRLVSTDGNRIHLIDVPNLSKIPSGLAIPVGVAEELGKILAHVSEPTARLHVTKKKIFLSTQTTTLLAPTLILPYPDISNLLTSSDMVASETVTVTKQDFLQAIASVRVTANQEYSTLSLTVAPKEVSKSTQQEWELVLESRVLRGHQGTHAIPAGYFAEEQKGRKLVVNYKHLLSALTYVHEDFVRLHIGPDVASMKAPLLIKSKGFTALIPQTQQVL